MNFHQLTTELKEAEVQLVAVSKTKSPKEIMEIYEKGQRAFGENRVNELREKGTVLPDDIQWHMIGHLQKNKVKHIAPFVTLIHSVDNVGLLKKVNKEAIKNDRIIDVLLQYKIAKEDSKFGLDPGADEEILDHIPQCSNVNVRGVMGMATFVQNDDIIRNEFKRLKDKFEDLKNHESINKDIFDTLSMGMSGDFRIAIEEGTTMVRIGSLIFGTRY